MESAEVQPKTETDSTTVFVFRQALSSKGFRHVYIGSRRLTNPPCGMCTNAPMFVVTVKPQQRVVEFFWGEPSLVLSRANQLFFQACREDMYLKKVALRPYAICKTSSR